MIQVQRSGIERRLLEIARVRVAGLISQPQVDLIRPALTSLRLQVRRQQHADSGTPGAQQRDRQLGGILEVHGHLPYSPGFQAGSQP
ncbi:hypothetical protein D3C73_1454190 [compost metagenome]